MSQVRYRVLVLALTLCPAAAGAQAAKPVMPKNVQVTTAITPLPAEFRESATVLGYDDAAHPLVQLRAGPGPFICLADDPKDERFHVACYHKSLEPFMARGRELRASGVTAVDSVRNGEVIAKKLQMPTNAAALYSMTGPVGSANTATGEITGANRLYVVYMPFATSESTGLASKPAGSQPWIMFPGSPKAHIMFTPTMN